MRTLTPGLVMTMAMIGWVLEYTTWAKGLQPPEPSRQAAGKSVAAARSSQEHWARLFNGRNLDGWYTFLQKHGKNSDPDRVITIEDGAIHLYKDAADASRVVMGYISTDKEYGYDRSHHAWRHHGSHPEWPCG
jgi:Domain of Unknown Function (DUF1080)